MKNAGLFILIDDDAFNNMLCSHIIRNTVKDAEVQTFSQPEAGLAFLSSLCEKNLPKAVVLIDINMPSLSGWDVLDRIATMPQAVLDRMNVYMFSSSVDQRDKDRARNNPLVQDYIEKPLDPAKLLSTVATRG